jgi:hypothetical protein
VLVDVAVKNTGAGHHFPTGIHIRNVILRVEALQNGVPLAQVAGPTIEPIAGVGDPRLGNFAGLPGRVYTRVYKDQHGTSGVFYTETMTVDYGTRIPAKQQDQQRFEFAAVGPGRVDVRVVLLYRRAYRHFVLAKGWTRDGHGNPLADVTAPEFGMVVAERKLDVVLP